MHSSATAALVAAALVTTLSLPAPADAETPRRADPTIASATESAALAETGWLEMEFTWRLAFSELNLQTGRMLASYAAADWFELRLGWDLFAVREKDAFGRESGVGDPRFDGKFRLPLNTDDHELSLVGGLQPGIGQPPLSVSGADLYGRALYSTWLAPVRLDANGGVTVNTEDEPSTLAVPLSVRAWWDAADWVGVWGEVVETLRPDDFSLSQTALGAGASFFVGEQVALDASMGVGLTTGLPDGFIQFGATFLATDFGRD